MIELISPKIISVQSLDERNLERCAEWITATEELPLISSQNTTKLTTDLLKQWFNSSLTNVVAFHDDLPIGLATLTKNEADIPDGIAEICHCIVRPEFRRIYKGSALIIYLMSLAKEIGLEKVVGRVVKSNTAGFALLNYLRWEKTIKYSPDNSTEWLGKSF